MYTYEIWVHVFKEKNLTSILTVVLVIGPNSHINYELHLDGIKWWMKDQVKDT